MLSFIILKVIIFNIMPSIILKFRVAKVQAEIVAQLQESGVRGQAFVNRICQNKDAVTLIDFLFRNAYYRDKKEAIFLYACVIFATSLNSGFISKEDRNTCFILLKARLSRMDSIDRTFRSRHCFVIGDIEVLVDDWKEISKNSEVYND